MFVSRVLSHETVLLTMKCNCQNNIKPYFSQIKPVTTGYLSDQKWAYEINGYGPVEINSSVGDISYKDGEIISLRSKKYKYGLGTHAYSDIKYHLNRKCKSLSVDIGIDDEITDTNASAIFAIYADGIQIYKSQPKSINSQVEHIKLNLIQVKTLDLETFSAFPDYINNLHTDWADAQIDCSD